MSIEVIYDNFLVHEGSNHKDIKELMSRDSSWGTFTKEMPAAEKTCGKSSYENWKMFQPKLSNLNEGRAEDQMFSLTFPKSNFNLEMESIDHLIGVIAGDIIRNPKIQTIRIADINFTENNYESSFPGPNIGINCLYEKFLSNTLNGLTFSMILYTTFNNRGKQ